MNSDTGYVYGFRPNDLFHLFLLQTRLRSVAIAGNREFEAFKEELLGVPKQLHPRLHCVKMRGLVIDRRLPLLQKTLRGKFPGYAAFFVCNRTIHEMLKLAAQGGFLGTINMKGLVEPQSDNEWLNDELWVHKEFWAFEQATNSHLFLQHEM